MIKLAATITLATMQALCPHTEITKGRWMESDVGHPNMSYSLTELSGYSLQVQKFIVLHECGHTHGHDTETGADQYAFEHIETTKEMVDEICQVVNTSAPDRPRCANLRKLYNDKHATGR